jgi:hydroxypyruvate reductase
VNNSKNLLFELAQAGISSVHGERLVGQAASHHALQGSIHLVAVGKAAVAMYAGAGKILGDRIHRALLITARGYDGGRMLDLPRVEILHSGHPVPTAESLSAGERLLQWIEATPIDGRYLFLISGGASSMVEVAVAGVTLSDLQRVNQWLLASGLDIEEINAVRRRLSCIKGGKLMRYLGHRNADVWLISDVAGDDPAVIGSGLLYPARDLTVPDVEYPYWLEQILARVGTQTNDLRAPSPDIPEHRVLGTLAMACEAVARQARQWDLPVALHATELSGDAEATGRRLGKELLSAAPGIHIWGGETTVRLPAQPGVGGRNQHLALAAAAELSGCNDVQLLALATDGCDGPGEDAGALVDGGTIERGVLSGLDVIEQLHQANSGRFLEASGDLVSTGPTGTNVRDLVLARKT